MLETSEWLEAVAVLDHRLQVHHRMVGTLDVMVDRRHIASGVDGTLVGKYLRTRLDLRQTFLLVTGEAKDGGRGCDRWKNLEVLLVVVGGGGGFGNLKIDKFLVMVESKVIESQLFASNPKTITFLMPAS